MVATSTQLPGVRGLTLRDGQAASGSTKSTVEAVLRRLFAWAREERIIPSNPALELRTGWGGSVRRRVIIPSIPQVLRLAEALDKLKPGLGDMAMVVAFAGLRWEEAVAVLIESVDLDSQRFNGQASNPAPNAARSSLLTTDVIGSPAIPVTSE